MPLPRPSQVFDAARMSEARSTMPTNLSTAELRDLGAEVLARSVFTARGTSAIFASKLKEVIDAIASGNMSESQARATLYQTLQAIGYTPEGGFPGDEGEVPPAIRGTLQDLSSFRRLDLIVRTQRELMQGAGEQWRGHQPETLAAFPAWELVRVMDVDVPRDWPSRWVIAGGALRDPDTGDILNQEDFGPNEWEFVRRNARMLALKGDPIWGELGSYENFPDALGVDFPPFAFNSGMGWRSVPAAEARSLRLQGPQNESVDEWLESGDGITMAGKLPQLPNPRMSLAGVAPELVERFKAETYATPVPGKGSTVDFSARLARSLAIADKAYGKGGAE